MGRKPKAIIVGPAVIGTFIEGLKPEWNVVAKPETIDELWEGLGNQTIDQDIDIILAVDVLFSPDDDTESLPTLISTMSPYCYTGIFQYAPQLEGEIRDKVTELHSANGEEESEYYFIPKDNLKKLDTSISRYIKITNNRDVASHLLGEEYFEDTPDVIENEIINADIDNLLDEDDENEYLGQVVAVTSSKGGSGKSTVTLTLATYLAHASEAAFREGRSERPLKIIVIDMDVKEGQVGFLTGALKPTILNIQNKGISEEVIEETIIHNPRLKLDLLLAAKRPRLSEDTPPAFYLELIQYLKKHYDYIILDTSVNYLDPLLEKVAYPVADQIIFVTDIVIQSVYSMVRWINEVTLPKEKKGMGIPSQKIGIVVNKNVTDVNMDNNTLRKSARGIPIISVIPNNAKLIANATNLRQMQVILKHPDIRHSIERLGRAVVGKKFPLSRDLDID